MREEGEVETKGKTGMSGIGPCGGGTSPWETTTDRRATKE
jgi:hypothetical protein